MEAALMLTTRRQDVMPYTPPNVPTAVGKYVGWTPCRDGYGRWMVVYVWGGTIRQTVFPTPIDGEGDFRCWRRCDQKAAALNRIYCPGSSDV